MPRVKGYLPSQQVEHQRKLLARRCRAMLAEAKISKSEVARYLNVSPQSICQQFDRDSITTSTLIAICTMTNAEADKIAELLKVR